MRAGFESPGGGPISPAPAPLGSNWPGREWGVCVGGRGGCVRLKQMSGYKEIVDALQKNRHHTLQPFLFVCMGHACVLGQKPSLEAG